MVVAEADDTVKVGTEMPHVGTTGVNFPLFKNHELSAFATEGKIVNKIAIKMCLIFIIVVDFSPIIDSVDVEQV